MEATTIIIFVLILGIHIVNPLELYCAHPKICAFSCAVNGAWLLFSSRKVKGDHPELGSDLVWAVGSDGRGGGIDLIRPFSDGRCVTGSHYPFGRIRVIDVGTDEIHDRFTAIEMTDLYHKLSGCLVFVFAIPSGELPVFNYITLYVDKATLIYKTTAVITV